MTSCYIQDVDPNARVTCGNCGWTGKASETAMIDDIQERITAGETVPAGQCPDEDCGALVYADEQPAPATTDALDTLRTAAARYLKLECDPAHAEGSFALDDARAELRDAIAQAEAMHPVEREPETPPAASKPYSVCFDIDGHGEGREYERPEEAAADVARYVLNMFRDGNPEDHCLTFGQAEPCESSEAADGAQ